MLKFQGVRGAYSESAAEKAYPNCEAVPCEQFDTAFEVNTYFFFLSSSFFSLLDQTVRLTFILGFQYL